MVNFLFPWNCYLGKPVPFMPTSQHAYLVICTYNILKEQGKNKLGGLSRRHNSSVELSENFPFEQEIEIFPFKSRPRRHYRFLTTQQQALRVPNIYAIFSLKPRYFMQNFHLNFRQHFKNILLKKKILTQNNQQSVLLMYNRMQCESSIFKSQIHCILQKDSQFSSCSFRQVVE